MILQVQQYNKTHGPSPDSFVGVDLYSPTPPPPRNNIISRPYGIFTYIP